MIGVQLDAGREPGEQVDWLEGDGHWLWRAACPRPCLPSSSRHLHLRRAGYHAARARSSADSQSASRRRRSAFPITDTELRLMAALAIIGERRSPQTG